MHPITFRWIAVIASAFLMAGCQQRELTPALHTPLPKTAGPKPTSSPSRAAQTPAPSVSPSGESAPAVLSAPLSAGGLHACLTTAAGTVRCWGGNEHGQLGNGTTGRASLPVETAAVAGGAEAVEAGKDHTCAIDSAGKVWCWGGNSRGQLGDGTTESRSTPAVAALAEEAVMLAAGDSFTCVLTASGGVKCWGWNIRGQLGDGTFEDRALPAEVVGLDGGVAAIAAGDEHACALLAAGGIRCWGLGSEGQLGSGMRQVSNRPTAAVGLPEGAVGIAAGGAYSCALTPAGQVVCWGRIGEQGSESDSLAAREVTGLRASPAGVAVGSHFACVVDATGGVECWGSNNLGQLGDGTTRDSWDQPVEAAGLTGPAAVLAAGDSHVCVLLREGGIQCWGDNYHWQLGKKAPNSSSIPIGLDVDSVHYYYSGIEAAAPLLEYRRKYPSLWDLTKGFHDLPAPGINTYAAVVNRESVWRLEFSLCAEEGSRLEAMLSSAQMNFLIDYQPVSEEAVLLYPYNYGAWTCQGWVTQLSQWENDQYEVAVMYKFLEDAYDGEREYAAGEYWQILLVKVEWGNAS